MIFNLENIENLKNKTRSGLTKYVCDYIIDNWDEKSDDDNNESILTNILKYGCESGSCSDLIYYNQTLKFYEDYEDEINELLVNLLNCCGYKSPVELFGDKWDDDDPLARDEHNQNLLAWFAFEETMRNVASEFDIW